VRRRQAEFVEVVQQELARAVQVFHPLCGQPLSARDSEPIRVMALGEFPVCPEHIKRCGWQVQLELMQGVDDVLSRGPR
jgi:hypothetical protein